MQFYSLDKRELELKEKNTEIFMEEEENLQKEDIILGLRDCKALLQAVFFLTENSLCLRGAPKVEAK